MMRVMAERPDARTAVLAERSAALSRLADEAWDLVVIGGGIVGAGVLLDATSRGLRAALLEQEDLAVGTSSRSSRLIHGGLRYLEDFRLHLVREALAERSRLVRLAPHLIRLHPFLFPVYGLPLLHRAFYGSGLVLYDLLGAARDAGRAHHLGRDSVAELAPSIRHDSLRGGLRGGITYHDGVEDDARFSLAVTRTAMGMGAEVATRTRATGLLTSDAGQIRGVTARDVLGGDEFDVRASMVVDATGVWAGHPEARLGGSGLKLAPSRGTHLLFERNRLPLEVGMTLRIPGRVLFIVPWPGAWIVGTTDVPDEGPPDRPLPTDDDAQLILDMVNEVLDVGLTREDAVGAYAGLRPLVGVPNGDTVRVSREHKVQRDESGLVRVSGGKYTTYRIMARDAVDVALEGRAKRPTSGTAELALVGAATADEQEALVLELTSDESLDEGQARALVDRHGTEARDVVSLGRELDLLRSLGGNIPHLEAEVAFAVRRELALDLDDVLSRRMRLSMMRRDRCASIAPRVAEIMAAELGWDETRRAREIESYLRRAQREYDVPGMPSLAEVA